MNEDKEKKVVELNLDDILPNRFQPRIKFEEKAINELADSIKKHGVIQPIIVREIGDKYEIIAGERRYKASVLAGKQSIPAIVTNLDDHKSAEIALIENIQRKDLSPIEEAISYKKILDMGYLNQEDLAARLDVSQSTISNKLRLLNLDEEVQEALLNNEISERHARSLLRLDNKNDQREMLKRIIKERLTVRRTDEEIDKLLNIGEKENYRNENNIMNESEPKNIFNIPSSPIIDDIEIFDDLGKFDEIEEPSFVKTNFDDVKENAINPGFLDIDNIEKSAEEINVEKPLADIDSLLKVDQKILENEPVKEEEQKMEMKHGKFFSFIDENNNDLINNNNDNFQLNTTAPEQFDNFDFDLSNISNLNNNEFELPEINYGETTIATSEPTNEETKNNSFNYDPIYDFKFDEFNQNQTFDDVLNESVPNYNIPDVNNNINFEVDKSKSLEEIVSDLKKQADQIKNYGYSVEVDELDLFDSYQIIITINKE